MAKIISIHSFRGGTGKSNTTANVAALLAAQGLRVGVVDTDIASPGIHVLFHLEEDAMKHSLNDYLWGKCDIADTAHDVTPNLGAPVSGKVYLIPSSMKPGEIARYLREGYDVGLLNDGFQSLIEVLNLDVLLIDTHPGLNEEALLTMRAVQTLIVVLRPDAQDLEGTGVTVQVARQLEVPHLMLMVNQLPATGQLQAVRARVEETFKCEVAAILPQAAEFMTFDNDGLFALRHAGHPISVALQHLAAKLTGVTAQVNAS